MTEDGLFLKGEELMEKNSLMSCRKGGIVLTLRYSEHKSKDKRTAIRGITIPMLVLIFICFSVISLPGAKGAEVKKEFEKKTLWAQVSQVSKPGEKEGRLKQPNTLTEEEQREFEKFGGNWESPSVFKNEKEAIKYLKILLKGNEKTIRWYKELDVAGKNKEETEKWKKWKYSDNIATALDAINIETNKEGYKLAVEVLRTKRDYPEALAKAALVVKFAHDPSVIPILRELVNYPVPSVRLQVAGSLLSLGDANTALPVLDELASQEGYVQALYYLFNAPGKIIDERGYRIVEKTLNNPKAEMRVSAAKLLFESKKLTKEKAEEIALNILKNFKGMEEYGIRMDPKTYKIVAIPGSGITDVETAEKRKGSDFRACENAISLLVNFKSRKAIPALEKISQNPGASYLARRAKRAIEVLNK